MMLEEQDERYLGWDACYNARDVGGYPTEDGRRTRRGVLVRSDDSRLLGQLEALLRADDPFVWPADEFEPVALEVERVFERLGLTQLALPLAA